MAKAKSKNPCIEIVKQATKAAGDKTISDDKAQGILTQVFRHAMNDRDKFNGSFQQSLIHNVTKLVNQQQAAVALKRRTAFKNLEAVQGMKERVRRFIDAGLTAGEGFRSLLVGAERRVKGAGFSVDRQVSTAQKRFVADFVAGLESTGLLKAWNALGSFSDEAKRVHHELWAITDPKYQPGFTGDKQAKGLADQMHAVKEPLIAWQNDAGAYIQKLPGHTVAQVWSRDRVSKTQKMPDGSLDAQKGSKEFWDFVEPRVDWSVVDDHGNRTEFKAEVYKNILSGDYTSAHSSPNPFSIKGGLAAKASAERKIHFLGPDEAWEVAEKFFDKDFKHSFVSSIYSGARRAVLMETLGPSFHENMDEAMKGILEDIKDRPDLTKHSDSILRSQGIKTAFATVTGETEIPGNPTAAKVQAVAQSLVNMSSLGASGLMSGITDGVGMHAEAARMGLPHMELLGKQIQLTFGGSLNPEEKKALRFMAVGLEGVIGSTGLRYGVHDKVPGWVGRTEEGFHTATGLNHVTNAGRESSAFILMNMLADHADKDFNQLPKEPATFLSRADIGSVEWDALRQSKVKTGPDREWIVSDNLDAIPQASKDALTALYGTGWEEAKRTLRLKYESAHMDQIDHMVINPTGDERSILLGGSRPGTWLGGGARLLAQFHSFPTAMTRKMIDRVMLFDNKTRGDFLKNDHWGKFRLAMVIASAGIAGYMYMTVKDMIAGKTPRSIYKDDGSMDVGLLMDAIRTGGAGGLYGDIALGEFQSGAKDFSSYIAGPFANKMDPLFNMMTKGPVEGKNISLDAVSFVGGMIPFSNHILARRAFDYLIGWQIQEMLDPEALNRQIRSLKKRTGQDYYPGRAPTDHLSPLPQ